MEHDDQAIRLRSSAAAASLLARLAIPRRGSINQPCEGVSMSEFQMVSESELQSVEGGTMLLFCNCFGVAVIVGYMLVKGGVV
jgi:hypothetical protein